MNGITRLEISRFEQYTSSRPLENAVYKVFQESCDVEIENKLFVRENGDLYTCSTAFLKWYYKSVYDSLADDIVIIIDAKKRYVRLESDPQEPEVDIKDVEIPKPYVPPKHERRQMHKQIKEHTDELSELLDELENTDDQPIKMNKAEMKIVKTVAKIAKLTKELFEPNTK